MRGESYKAVCAFLMIFSVPAGILAWYTDRPGAVAWSFRIGSIVVCVLFGGLLFRAMARRDKATDHLRALVGNCPKIKLMLPVDRLATSNDNFASVPKHPG